VLLVPNAANAAGVAAALEAAAPEGVVVLDRHHDLAVLALQGPRADEVLTAAGLPVALDYMAFAVAEVGGPGKERAEVIVCRTGYTGERGYELLVPATAAVAVWDLLVAAGTPLGLRAAGLGARDTLRTEMGYPLHGQDLSTTITPVQARVGWAVGWSKPTFTGVHALRAEKEAGPARLLRGLRAEGRGIPRAGMVVRDADGTEVGVVTSGTFSPSLKTGIALALLDASVTEGTGVTVDVRSRREPFRVVRPPFVPSHVR
jgi:aminomethyltransferase